MDGGLEPITFWDIHLVFDRRLPEREAAGDTAPASAASAFETAIAGVPSTNIPPPPPIFVSLRPRQVRFLPEWTGRA